MIASLHDEQRRITVPGFYDDVVQLTPADRAAFAALPFDESAYLAAIGAGAPQGEDGYSTVERRGGRPTLDVNGIWGGFTGDGSKLGGLRYVDREFVSLDQRAAANPWDLES